MHPRGLDTKVRNTPQVLVIEKFKNLFKVNIVENVKYIKLKIIKYSSVPFKMSDVQGTLFWTVLCNEVTLIWSYRSAVRGCTWSVVVPEIQFCILCPIHFLNVLIKKNTSFYFYYYSMDFYHNTAFLVVFWICVLSNFILVFKFSIDIIK